MEDNSNKLTRRTWTAEETKAFLDAYRKRQFEFESAKLKKFAMQNVLEDLIALGVLTQPTTVEMLKIKLKNLMRSFKTSIDNNKRTGASLIRAPFEAEMIEIFGSQPIITNNHSLNLSGRQIQGLPMGSSSTKEDSMIIDSSPAASISSPRTPTTSAHAIRNTVECPTPTVSPATTSKRMGPRQKYWQMREERAAGKFQLLKEYTASKLKKMDEAEEAKEARLARKEKLLRELFNKP